MELTQEDYIIICGDFGLCWAKDKTFEYHCKNFAEKPYTILWVQGNHENYDMIGEYPREEWHGGKVRHIIRDKVILLERGQVFEIEGKSFFAFGGASSHDIQGGILDRQTVDFAEQKRRADRAHLHVLPPLDFVPMGGVGLAHACTQIVRHALPVSLAVANSPTLHSEGLLRGCSAAASPVMLVTW